FCGEAGGGTDCGGAGDLTPVYSLRFDPDETPTEEAFFEQQIKDTGTYSSRWQMQLGVRLTF
ncbi:MAG: hypothetical protein R3362_03935, partial [Rhodothermales bacterium]|nr:hypothetical protein [Rhodothermales bacterium]